ncbi:MAG: DUF6323 family protein [Bacillota bacterium]|nr:DUF6323 family protein [Bacillota bacterium]
MKNEEIKGLTNIQKSYALAEIQGCNDLTFAYGLSLTETQMIELVEARFNALQETGRIEFGHGVLKKLIETFCDSPYLTQENYLETLFELQDSFYYFKNESQELLSDDELITFMKIYFDGFCQGSTDCLSGTSLEELCRRTRYGDDDMEDEEMHLF